MNLLASELVTTILNYTDINDILIRTSKSLFYLRFMIQNK